MASDRGQQKSSKFDLTPAKLKPERQGASGWKSVTGIPMSAGDY